MQLIDLQPLKGVTLHTWVTVWNRRFARILHKYALYFPLFHWLRAEIANGQESNLNERNQLISRDLGNIEVQFRTF